jgi:hypothetical protein
MAMDADILGPALKSAVQSAAAADPSDSDAMFKAMADAIILHIQTYATVTVTTACPAGAGTGAGAGGAIL